MSLTKKPRRAGATIRSNYAVFKKRRRRRLFVLLLLLATLALWGIGSSLSPILFEETSEETLDRVDTPADGEAPQIIEQDPVEEETVEEEPVAPPPPEDPTLFLTVPKLGLFEHTVRNDDSEAALGLGAIKVPGTGFPWQEEDTNTYVACHRIGFPGTESYNQCLSLPAMQAGDEVTLSDTNGTVYEYRVSEVFAVSPEETWVTNPIPGRDVISLQTCTETPEDWWTIGPSLFGGGPESGRLVVRADRVT